MGNYDVVIIGGGVIGAATAYYLSLADMKVAIVERGDLASGTSSGCDGNILISDKQPGIDTSMTYISQQLLSELVAEIPYNFEYSQRGSLLAIESEAELKAAEEFVTKQVEDGYPLRILSRQELLKQEPYFAADILGGVEIDCDASLNPMALVYGLLKEAEKNGVNILRFCPVLAIKKDAHGAVAEIVTKKGVIRAEHIVNCAGVWAPEIARMVEVDLPIKPRQGQLLITEQTIPIAKRKVMEFGYLMAKFGIKDYQREVTPELDELGIALVVEPTQAGNFLIGSSRAFVGFNKDISIRVMRGIAERAMRFFPVLKDVNVVRAYAGLRPFVPDHFPIISQVEQVPGFYLAAGHEGDGIGLAPITGLLIKQMIMGEETVVPTEKLSIDRFSKNSVRGKDIG